MKTPLTELKDPISMKEAASKSESLDGLKEAAANAEGYINIKEAAAFLSIPVNTCYKLCLSRTLPSYKAGKLRRLKKSEVVAYMESNRVEARPVR